MKPEKIKISIHYPVVVPVGIDLSPESLAHLGVDHPPFPRIVIVLLIVARLKNFDL